MASFNGRGLSFPLRLSDRDRLTMVEDDADIRQAIRIILFTVPGERVMRPDFGCEIHSLIFYPANQQTAILAERYVREALLRWEPRIELETVTVTPGATELGELWIDLRYRLKGQYDPRSLVFPYYLAPESNGA
jgi:hypothetical protein